MRACHHFSPSPGNPQGFNLNHAFHPCHFVPVTAPWLVFGLFYKFANDWLAVLVFQLLPMLALGEDDDWAEWRIRCMNHRQKGNSKDGLAFVISHPSRKGRGEDGAPSLVVGAGEQTHAWGVLGCYSFRPALPAPNLRTLGSVVVAGTRSRHQPGLVDLDLQAVILICVLRFGRVEGQRVVRVRVRDAVVNLPG